MCPQHHGRESTPFQLLFAGPEPSAPGGCTGAGGPRLPPSQATSPGSQQMDDVLESPSGFLLEAYPLPGGPQWEGGVLQASLGRL